MSNIQGDNMKRIEAIKLLNGLKSLKKDKSYSKFLIFSISKTTKELEALLKEIQEKELTCYSEEYKTFTESRKSLLYVYSEKDTTGNPIVENDAVKIVEDKKDEFSEKMTELLKLNEETIKETDTKLKELDEWTKEDVEINITKTFFKNLPDELTQEEFEVLSYLVKEDEVE